MASPKRERAQGFKKATARAIVANAVGTEEVTYVEGRVRSSGGSGADLYRFTLNEDWSSGVADADILEMDGTDTTTDADINDPLDIFSDMSNGDPGICLLAGGSYYVIQAPCSGTATIDGGSP